LPRSDETENERLLREAGLLEYQHEGLQAPPPPPPPAPVRQPAGVREAAWDVYTTAHAPQLVGDLVEFATLPSGDVIIDLEEGDADLSPLADAVEKHLRPPYRATGRREQDALWAVAARRIEVRALPPRDGDAFDVVVRNGQPDFFGLDPEGEYAVRAERLDGDLWEIQVGVL
jgi:hypothetical protein